MTRTNLSRTNFRALAVRTLMLALASLGAQCQQAGQREVSLRVYWSCPRSVPSLSSVWGASGNDVLAVGDGGTVFRYDGSGWRESQIQTVFCSNPDCERPGIRNYGLFSDVWGSSRSDVYVAANSLLHFDGTNWLDLQYYTVTDLDGHHSWPLYDFFQGFILNAVWGSSASNVFAVGSASNFRDEGAIIHYDGANWRSMLSPPNSGGLNSVWGSSASLVNAVGDHTYLVYDGFQWTHWVRTLKSLRRVWGSAADDVFAVGDEGTIFHNRQPMESGTTENLSGVWGSSGNDVFAVGVKGTILHYDGSSWRAQTSGIESPPGGPFYARNNDLKGVWGTSASDVFAVGNNGTILHYDGSSWSIQSLRVRVTLTRSIAAPDERILSCSGATESMNDTTFRYRIARDEDWTVNGELLSYAGTVVARDSAVVRAGTYDVELSFEPSTPPSSGSVVLRWTLNGSQPSDDLVTLCRNNGAATVVATANGGQPESADCGLGTLLFTQLSGAVTLHARLVNAAGVDVAPPKDVTVQVVPGAAIDAHVDFQVSNPCQVTGTTHSAADITANETWTAAASPHHVPSLVPTLTVRNGAVLTVEPGAIVCLGQGVTLAFAEGARLVAGAPGGYPVRFTGDYQGASNPPAAWRWIFLSGSPTVHSAITNAIIEYAADAAVFTNFEHPVLIDATMIRRSGNVLLRAPGSQMTRSTVDGTGVTLVGPGSGMILFQSRVKNAPGPAAITISGSNVALSLCEIIGSAHDGVSVEASVTSNVTVNGCNLKNNSGLAINNASGTAVTADNDWWDPPGDGSPPRIGSPNGVSANVTVTNVQSGPVMLEY